MREIKLQEAANELIEGMGDGYDAVCIVAIKGGKSGTAISANPHSVSSVMLAAGMIEVLAGVLEKEAEAAFTLKELGLIGGKTEKASMILKGESGDLGRVSFSPKENGDPMADVFLSALGSGFEAYLKGMRERAGK